MKALSHRRFSRLLALALVAVWMVTVTAAGAAVIPAMHCHGVNMPCCPPATSSSMARCLDTDCIEQVPQKAEAGLEAQAAILSPAVVQSVTPQPVREPMRLLHAGMRFHAPVFRLKDDFRI
ncbi:MAG TPA: hypothetical protein VJV22_20780 [Acidobacteriaceae bacterium]|nr:hypothetical protein [Acidobacteriaceae bacterium]